MIEVSQGGSDRISVSWVATLPVRRSIRFEMARPVHTVSVAQLTVDGGYRYPWYSNVRGEATFSSSYSTCYFDGKTFHKIKGGQSGGNYRCVEDDEIYRIWQNKN